jgi:predicted ATPase/DNA-binding SARP family transcriptional activator/tetratricopeptide (TPR) repeat protein
MVGLEISVLGPPRIVYGGAHVAFARRKTLALLTYLAITHQPHSRETLAALFWAELDDTRARAALRRALIDLSQGIGKEWLITEGDRLALRQDIGLNVDVLRFRELLAKVSAHSHSGYRLCDDCLNALREAVALYRADFLAGFSLRDAAEFDAWQTYQSETLRLELGGALEKLATGLAGAQQYSAAIGHARRWLALDSLNEAAHALLMRLFAWSGDRAAVARQYGECIKVLADELGVEPEPGTTALFYALTSGKIGAEGATDDRLSPLASVLALAAPPPLHNLAPDATAFVGRETELSQLAARLTDPACRLLTVIGPGGIGKTRLAVQAARRETERFSHGVYLVDLAPLTSAEFLGTAILHTLQVSERGTDPEQRLLDFLRDKQMLLVLDNYEHFLSGSGTERVDGHGLLNSMLAAAPHLKLLITSRARLNLRAEWLAPLSGLEVPPREDALVSLAEQSAPETDHLAAPEQALAHDGARSDAAPDLESYSATALFLSSVRRLRFGFEPTAEDARQIARICRLLEGIPLAIELAAARVRTLALGKIADELERDLALLATTMRDVPQRHRSMIDVFDYSWRLLSVREQSILRQLSVFLGGFSAEAAEAIAGAALADLGALVDTSWVQTASPGRFALHELIRQYCAGRLAAEHASETGEDAGLVRDRHAAYFHSFILQQFQMMLRGKGSWVETARDMDNLLAAWDWLWMRGDLTAIRTLALGIHWRADRLGWYRSMSQLFTAAQLRLDELAHRLAETPENRHQVALARAVFLTSQSETCSRIGLPERADALVAQAEARLEADDVRDDEWKEVRWVLRRMTAWHKQFGGDIAGSAALFRELLLELEQDRFPMFPYTHDSYVGWQGEALWAQGFNALALGQYAEARRFAEQSIAAFEGLDNEYMVTYAARVQVLALMYTGDFEQAQKWALASLKTAQAYQDRYAIPTWLVILGRLYLSWGKHDLARIYLRRNLAATREAGMNPLLANSLCLLGDIELALGNAAGARRLYEESLERYATTDWTRSPAFASCANGLGRVALGSGDLAVARAQFRQALMAPLRSPEETAAAIAGLARVLNREGEVERAAELLAFVANWPATPYTIWSAVKKMLLEVESKLPLDLLVAATARGRARRSDDIVADLVGEQQ